MYSKAGDKGELHMWNSVRMPDEQWYGVDVTWNDPSVRGGSGAKSGRESEDFLLVGADTVILGLKFSASHVPKNRAADGGVSFINGPTLSIVKFKPLAGAHALPFTDVDGSSWYYGVVEYVYDNGLMRGTSKSTFAPGQPATRAMIWTVLGRMAGETLTGGSPWYVPAQRWAVEAGVSDGKNPNTAVTREQLVTMLWRYAGSPASSGSLERFSDRDAISSYAVEAMRWAVENGVIAGMGDGTISPRGTATRAQLAAILERFNK